jgi:cellulose synthase/poly-beta-1,6-N-acetylglucosamine synthase-like glycosyltransferase
MNSAVSLGLFCDRWRSEAVESITVTSASETIEHNVNPQYSIVIPAYNESARIGHALEEVLRTLDEKRWNAEVLVVNDGSTDNTAAIVEGLRRRTAECGCCRTRPIGARATACGTGCCTGAGTS